MTREVAWKVGLILIGLMLVYLSASTLPGSPNPAFCEADETAWICVRSWMSAVGPVIAALALFLAFSQFDLARSTSVQTLRAYVMVETAVFRRHSADRFEFIFKLKNHGKTPAHDVSIETTAIPFEQPIPVDINWKSEPNGGSLAPLGPDASVEVSQFLSLNYDELTSFKAGVKIGLVLGTATYKDIFNITRVTRFRYELHREPNQGFRVSENGNSCS